ncbi:PREDICTED: uncharacterized protein LOC105314457 [Amphimedon queenslandica]|uniref:Uncharacterized protein n=1 Tax=Amphimedon queenslandica TaxID=400682 RepID=A0A1X7TSE0_AMPQE|nr:PREDICTED: uncharacterized protein LOC105314457 [Amphimedon queenslandica]|eukprot:XP_019858032.1 PREDICTED: uncharacterized protein LOC105314457 [Amphimedon queenslandica]
MDRVHVCYHLLNKGADASQRDSDNKTPLDYALIKQHEFVVALFTCHDASVGDFIKMQRSEADTGSLYSGGTDGCSLVSESVSFIAPSEYANRSNVTGIINHYLGYFIPGDNKCPPLHYYFWIKGSKLYWSRSIKRHNRKKGTVLSVIGGASQRIKDREDYSPNDLHRYSFCVITEEELLDLIAYSEDSFKYWMQSLEDISVHNNEMMEERREEEEGEGMEEGTMCRDDDQVMGTDGFSSGPSPLFSSTPLHNGQTRTLYPNNVI